VKQPGDGYKTQRPATDDNHIRNWRLFRGFRTQNDLAKACGLSRPRISNLESGEQPYMQHHLDILANTLDCAPADLISIDPSKTPDILKIYNRLSPVSKQAVDNLIKSLHPATRGQKAEA
jgi:transcriptional regulator with XRE-family HTH domain